MTPTPPVDKIRAARKERRRRLHERQAVVYGLLITVLAVAALGAIAVYTGVIESPIKRGFSVPQVTSEYAGIKPPCLPAGTLPVPANDVSITILNATDIGGVAKENKDILVDRGFNVTGIGNASKQEAQTQIRFGAQGLAAAYTLAAHFPSPLLLLDGRTDATVDLIIGADYTSPVDTELTGLDPGTPMKSVTGCASLASIRPLPAPTSEPTAAATPETTPEATPEATDAG